MFLLTLAICFILRLRFPTGSSITRILRRRYGNPVVLIFRKFEKANYKLKKCRADLSFLNECQLNKLYPNFLKFKLWKKDYSFDKACRNFQDHLLKLEIKSKTKEECRIKHDLDEVTDDLKQKVSWLDWNHLLCFVDRINDKKIDTVERVHQRKLFNLGLEKERETLDPDCVVFNFSTVRLSEQLKSVLARGLRYAIPPNKLNLAQFLLPFEKLLRSLHSHNTSSNCRQGVNYVKTYIKNVAFSTYYSFNPSKVQQNLSSDDLESLKCLAKNKDVIITRPDKGQGVVLLDKTDYIDKVLHILSDCTKFVEIKDACLPLILKAEDRLNRLLRKFKELKIISDVIYSTLYASGSVPGILYGLPKVHKPGLPMRPILSAIGTLNYNISKYFIPILKPLTTNQYTIKDTFTFVKTLLDIQNANDFVMASFDVSNLFTNVPLNETINIILELLFHERDNVNGMNKNQFKSLLEIATNDILFYFNGKLYKQIDGVAMGSPLGPTLANIFMSYYEEKWLQECPQDFKPSYYYRYVDDTFLLFRSSNHIKKFLEFLNSRHQNIKFTCEIENNNSLPFLDVNIRKMDNTFTTSVYHKPTYTGLTTRYDSFIPSKYKDNLISTLIYRAFHISKDFFIMAKEFDFIKDILRKNGYPLFHIENVIRKTLNCLLTKKPQCLTVPKDLIVLKLPYLGNMSHSLSKNLMKLIRSNYSTVEIRVIFTNINSIGKFFSFKDRIPVSLRSSIVYHYKCGSCNASYIGKTSRNLSLRIDEHKGISFRTKRPLKSPMQSAIREHSSNHDHPILNENFQILDNSNLSNNLDILESVWIWKKRPTLNEYLSSTDIEILK